MEESEKNLKVYTQQEADELVKELKNVFDIVRILQKDEVGGIKNISDGVTYCKCFDFWGKKVACVNCISSKTLQDHKDRTKVEVSNGIFYQVLCKYINIEGKDCIIEMLKDINNLNIETQDLKELSKRFLTFDSEIYKDALTGCLNRRFYEERKLERFTAAGIVICDMDNLKDVNDIYGHVVGDLALKSIGKVLLDNVRSDDFVIRYGGDEFIIILPNILKNTLSAKLEKIRREVNQIVLPEHDKVKLSVSMGAIIVDEETLQTAIAEADKLMYQAKTKKNCVVTLWDKKAEEITKKNTANKLYVLIVDDSDINRFLLKSMLEDKYNILEASDGKEAIEVIEDYRQNISLILLDIEMPNMGGFEYLNYLKSNNFLTDIPVIMISSDNNEDVILRSYELGAIDFITRPYNAKIVEQRVENITNLFLRQRRFKSVIRQQMERSEEESRMLSVIYSYAIEYRNKESGVHVLHVQQLTEALINELVKNDKDYNYSSETIKTIVEASAMHDIGKIGVREEILNKTTPLTFEETEEYKKHTIIGANILDSMVYYKDEPLVKYAKEICRWHHERYDGSGYPDGLKGDEIPIEVQIVALANEYDSLLVKNATKEDPHGKAIELLLSEKANKFNPKLLELVKEAKDVLRNVYSTNEEIEVTNRTVLLTEEV